MRAMESATTWPERSTSIAELIAVIRRKRRMTALAAGGPPLNAR
jgi:hypothetical protein